MLDGATLGAIWPELLVTTVWGLGAFAVALALFRWE